jgi:NAD(P)-dependent dehydrogenase (short-subunit alcohol dehydrogenase family)
VKHTDGIGVTTAKNLMRKGYNVIVHGRDPKRIEKACEAILSFQDNTDGLLFSVCANLETVKGSTQVAREVETLCEKHNLQLTVLMNNAGVYAEDLKITSDGTEETFAVNVVAPFVITSLLMPVLLKQKSRIVIASSISQSSSIRHWDDINYKQRPYSAHGAYSESKLFDAMLSMEFAYRLKDAGIGTDQITCNCLDPGTVNTKMLLAGWGPCGIDVEDALDQT